MAQCYSSYVLEPKQARKLIKLKNKAIHEDKFSSLLTKKIKRNAFENMQKTMVESIIDKVATKINQDEKNIISENVIEKLKLPRNISLTTNLKQEFKFEGQATIILATSGIALNTLSYATKKDHQTLADILLVGGIISIGTALTIGVRCITYAIKNYKQNALRVCCEIETVVFKELAKQKLLKQQYIKNFEAELMQKTNERYKITDEARRRVPTASSGVSLIRQSIPKLDPQRNQRLYTGVGAPTALDVD